jgi:hypothetical protein
VDAAVATVEVGEQVCWTALNLLLGISLTGYRYGGGVESDKDCAGAELMLKDSATCDRIAGVWRNGHFGQISRPIRR